MYAFPFAAPMAPHPAFADLAAALAGCGAVPASTSATARARSRAAPAPAPPKKTAAEPPKPAPATPAVADVAAVTTPTGWAYSIELPGRPLPSLDVEVIASSDGGPARVVVTAPRVEGGAGRRARPGVRVGFDLEKDADPHSVRADGADGELVLCVDRVEPAAPVKIKVAIAGAAANKEARPAPPAPPAPAAPAPVDDDEDGSWASDDDEEEEEAGSSKKGGGAPKSGAVLEAVADDE